MYLGKALQVSITGFDKQDVIDKSNQYCKENEGWSHWSGVMFGYKWMGWFKWKKEYEIKLYKPIDYKILRIQDEKEGKKIVNLLADSICKVVIPFQSNQEISDFVEYVIEIGFKKYKEGWCQAGGSNGWHCTIEELYKKFKEENVLAVLPKK